jgi:hypothetical protein
MKRREIDRMNRMNRMKKRISESSIPLILFILSKFLLLPPLFLLGA